MRGQVGESRLRQKFAQGRFAGLRTMKKLRRVQATCETSHALAFVKGPFQIGIMGRLSLITSRPAMSRTRLAALGLARFRHSVIFNSNDNEHFVSERWISQE